MKVKHIYMIDNKQLKEFNFMMRHGKQLAAEVNHYKVKPLQDYEFGQVKEVQGLWQSKYHIPENVKILSILTKTNEHVIGNYDMMEFVQNINYIGQMVEDITEMENNHLGGVADSISVAAGIDNFSKFGAYNQIRELADGDVLKIDAIEKTPYMTCYMELLYRQTLNDYDKKRIELSSRIKK